MYLHWASSNSTPSAIFQDAKTCLIGNLAEGREVAYELCSIEEVLKHVGAN